VFALLVSLALAVGPPGVVCDGLKIEGPTIVPAYRFVRLKATGHEAGSVFDWSIDKDAQADVEERGDTLLFVGPPGDYVVTCTVFRIAGTTLTKKKCRVRVTIEGTSPKPPDTPKPPGRTHQTKEEAEKALCRLRVGSSGCTATIIGPRRADGRWDILTAAHCWGAASTAGTVTLQDGKVLKVKRVAIDRAADICWMVTDDVIETLPHAWLCETVPPVGTGIWHAGWGVDRPRNTERGKVSGAVTRDGKLTMLLNVSSGDSGGGIFRDDTNEVVSNVCCTVGRGSYTTTYGGVCTKAVELRPKG
jgi:hypothetical protein